MFCKSQFFSLLLVLKILLKNTPETKKGEPAAVAAVLARHPGRRDGRQMPSGARSPVQRARRRTCNKNVCAFSNFSPVCAQSPHARSLVEHVWRAQRCKSSEKCANKFSAQVFCSQTSLVQSKHAPNEKCLLT